LLSQVVEVAVVGLVAVLVLVAIYRAQDFQ
jgi:hypothetical protein